MDGTRKLEVEKWKYGRLNATAHANGKVPGEPRPA